jgi:hypothetical protein
MSEDGIERNMHSELYLNKLKNNKNNNNIIPGYHGIIDLDVSNIAPIYMKQAIDQHYNDIKIYTMEQSKLKPECRYENTVLRVQNRMDRNKILQQKYYDDIKKQQYEYNIKYNNSKF